MNAVSVRSDRIWSVLSILKTASYVITALILSGIDWNVDDNKIRPGFGTVSAQELTAGKATIVIESVSNSLATRGKNLLVTYYQNEQCGRRGKTDRVFKKNYVKDLHRFNTLAVEIDEPFIFQVSYTEKRRDETRSCAAISNVTLEENRSYKAVFNIVDQVIGCNIKVFDVTDIDQAALAKAETDKAQGDNQVVPESSANALLLKVPMMDKRPMYTCSKVNKQGYKSGTPVYSYKDRLG